MNRNTFKLILLLSSVFFTSVALGQDSTEYYTKAKRFINQGKLDSAGWYLGKALEQSPDNLQIQEDLVYLRFLDRDSANATELSKKLATRPDATVKTFQLAGMVYKEILEFKEGKKLYDKALLKFPNSGLLYAEYGDLFSLMEKPGDAIKLWEKGIEADPGYSGNYYNAAKYYAENKIPFWAMIYGETFVNIESYSDRSAQIRQMLAELYKRVTTPGFLVAKNNPFATAVIATYAKQPPVTLSNMSPAVLTMLRTTFLHDWNKEYKDKFPFKLFEYHDQLIKEGMFDAYNQWLFSAINPSAYQSWMDANKEKAGNFRNFQAGRVYKVPSGQYYQTK